MAHVSSHGCVGVVRLLWKGLAVDYYLLLV